MTERIIGTGAGLQRTLSLERRATTTTTTILPPRPEP
jgi:hypothetical protein